MGTASLHFDTLSLAWRGFWSKVAWRREPPSCTHFHRAWHRLRVRPHAVLLEGSRYCIDRCLEDALRDSLERLTSVSKRVTAAHRIPLGLLLLSRQQLTAEQLRIALETQRVAGRGRIGDWIQSLGFANEMQVTAALARQWSCPLLRANSSLTLTLSAPHIPPTLLETFTMIPVNYVEATSTLHIAFAEGIDYTTLYAIERMTGCHTEPCVAAPSFVRAQLQLPSLRAEHEAVFECVSDTAEFCRIVHSYASRLSASEIRLARCGPYIWIRLRRRSCPPQDLLLRPPQVSSPIVSLLPSLLPAT